MKKNLFVLNVCISLFLMSCSDNEANTEQTDQNADLYAEVLSDVSLNVITETYFQLYTNASALHSAANLMTVGNETQLQAVKDAWVATRAPWEMSEGFLYGPVDTEGIDPAIDSWPVNVNDINNILDSGENITSTSLESNNEARGFHTIEYFIWGLNGDKTASELTERELEYLRAATQNLNEKTQQLYEGWLVSEGDFSGNFINAGNASSIYTSQIGALLEIVEGLTIIADEVANGKIEEPLNGNGGAAKPEAEESRFSNNSKLDFANNMRSIQNVYTGDFNGLASKGITDIVASENATLDTEIKTAISAAISSIENIPGTFTEAIEINRSEVENAQTKVTELLTLLEANLEPLISNL